MRASNSSIPSAGSLRYDPEIVAVEMHWVREGNDTVKNKANRPAASEVVNVPLGIVGIRSVTEIGEQKQRMTILSVEMFGAMGFTLQALDLLVVGQE
jgi:hypothetical protein